MKKWIIILAALFAPLIEASACRGGGGDGPVPMYEPDPYLPTIWTQYGIKGPVKELIYWEKKQEVVYRNASEEVRHLDLKWSSDSKFFGYPWELVRTTDPEERFLVTRRETSVIDTRSKPLSITQIRTPDPFSDAVFWYRDTLFGLMGTRQRLSFFGYRAGSQEAFSCNVPIAESGVRLAQGAQFPNAFLFREEAIAGGTQVTLYKIRLSTHWMGGSCDIVSQIKVPELITGRVKGVHLIRGGHALAIEIENKQRPILYATEQGCVYHDFDGTVPMLPNPGLPYAVGRDSKGKLQLFDLDSETKRRLVTFDEFEKADPNKLWLTRDGAHLVAVLKDARSRKEKVVRFDLKATE